VYVVGSTNGDDASVRKYSATGPTPSAAESGLEFGSAEELRYVPADGKATTKLVAIVKDRNGNPLSGRTVKLQNVSDSVLGDEARETNSQGKATFVLKDEVAESVRFSLIDITGGGSVDLRQSKTVHFTRKVVVLVMGFRSSLPKRFCYFGDNRGLSDCESIGPEVLAGREPFTGAPGTVYAALDALGYAPGMTRTSADAGASIMEMSWTATTCGANGASCVADILSTGQDVAWIPKYYDIGGINAGGSLDRQNDIDKWAGRLVNTLAAYDQALADPDTGRGYHASFHLVGHSMGGELVVRALGKALGHEYFGPSRRGIIPAVISVDGALNWGSVAGGSAPAVRELVPSACGSPVRTARGYNGDAKEEENAANVRKAASDLGTTTLGVTNSLDAIVRTDIALLNDPVKPQPGYGERVYRGYGESEPIGDPGCGHSTLLRSQAVGLENASGAQVYFPLGDLIAKYVGQAVDEPGVAPATRTRRSQRGNDQVAPAISQPPFADPGGPYAVREGGTVRLDGRGSGDPDGRIVSYLWSRPARLDDPTAVRPVFSAVDDGGYSIGLTVTDDDGATMKGKTKIKVTNVVPVIEHLADLEVNVGEKMTIEISFTDAGNRDTHLVSVDWGDGTSGEAVVDESRGAGTAHAAHAYVEPGDYVLTVTVRDADGGEARSVTTVRAAPATAD
jgi:hypothetical protein